MLHQTHAFLPAGASAAPGTQRSTAAIAIDRILTARKARADHLPGFLFCDPAWDILLFLAMVDMDQRRATVKEACLEANAPHSTALRYIGTLEAEGLVTRVEDRFDRRRKYIALTDRGRVCMWNFLANNSPSELRAA